MRTLSPGELLDELQRDFPEIDALQPGVFFVGGALRDLLSGVVPADVDLVCRDARTTAAQFARRTSGTLVDLGRESFPTFRIVVSRRTYDFNEMSGSSIGDDLGRRDFTVNAMAFDPHAREDVVDPFGGSDDLRNGIVRMVAEANIADDPLRILKGIRTAVTRQFEVEPATAAAFRAHSGTIATVARERVTAEMWRMFDSSDAARALELLRDAGADAAVLAKRIDERTVDKVRRCGGCDAVVVWALLFGDEAGRVENFAREWRWSEEARRDVSRLLALRQEIEAAASERQLLVALYDAGEVAAKRLPSLLDSESEQVLARRVSDALARNPHLFETTAALSGDEIAELTGLAPGKLLGSLKRALLEAQIAGEITGRDAAEEFVRSAARTRSAGREP